MIRIPLGGFYYPHIVRGEMIVDDVDADMADLNWTRSSDYAVRHENRRKIYAHRAVLERKLGRPLVKGEFTDHINHDKLDNRRDNLRAVTKSQNGLNRRGPAAYNETGGYLGVSKVKAGRTWCARIRSAGGGVHYRGRFATPEEAAAYAADKRKEIFCMNGSEQCLRQGN